MNSIAHALIVNILLALVLGSQPGAAWAASASTLPPFTPNLEQSNDITIDTLAVEYTFAQRITFRVVARSESAIASAVVFFRAGSGAVRTGPASIGSSGVTTQATYSLDLPGDALPPFTTITYWWEIANAAGHKLTTPSKTVDYVDNRFGWQSIVEGSTRIYWHEGDQTFGQSALDATRAALPRLNEIVAASLPTQVDVYVYSSADELQSTLLLAGRPWQGGQARPDLGVVLIAASPGPDSLLQLRRAIAHELMHLLVYQASGSGYANVPRWLDEGLAVLYEGSPDPAYQLTLEAAFRNDSLLSIETLCAPFPDDPQMALLSYSQSYSLVKFVHDKYGLQGIRALLAAYNDGASCTGGIERALDISPGALELAWRSSLGPQGMWQAVFGSIGAWVVLALLLLIAPIPFVLGKRKSKNVH